MNFVDIHPAGQLLDSFLENEKPSPILEKIGEAKTALHLMRSGLWFSKMFNRYAVPAYGVHIFKTVSLFESVNDELGTLLAGVSGIIKGELFNNNIYGNPRECHSHYEDMLVAYLEAGGKLQDQDLVRPEYETALETVLANPLATFIFIAANEKWTPPFFEAVSKNLCQEARFDKYRQFVNRHIELDRGEHSSTAMKWLSFVYRKDSPFYYGDFESAVSDVILLMSSGR